MGSFILGIVFMSLLISGFILGLSLIVAIGPQNAFIIKQGIRREHLVPIIAACALSDVVLIFAGVAGVGVLVERFPTMLMVIKYAGAAYLLYFAYTCFQDARKEEQGSLVVEETAPTAAATTRSALGTATLTRTRTWVAPVLTVLALTWLNPLAYVDAMVMIGGLANRHGEEGRWVFGVGSLIASMVWFPLLGFGSYKLAPVLTKPRTWQIVNVVIGCIMLVLTARLLMS